MDTSDDPDITAYHLKIRARSTDSINVEEGHEEKPAKYSWKNFIIRVVLACVFIGLGVGLLIWSVSRRVTEPTVAPPEYLNLTRSESCTSDGTVKISSPGTGTTLPSVWLHNDGKRQLKITLGDRQTAKDKWILDMYFLQYGGYVATPDDSGHADLLCYVDFTMNYGSVLGQFSNSKLYEKNSSNSLDVYRGQFGKADNGETAEIWTDDKEKIYSLKIAAPYANFDYEYGTNMKDSVPSFDDDIINLLGRPCQQKDINAVIKERVQKYLGL